MLSCRPVQTTDLPVICGFPQSQQELFFMFPKAEYPLTVAQLEAAIAQRFESTCLLAGSEVIGFANYYRCEPGVSCSIGNVIIAPTARGKGAGRTLVTTMIAIAFDKHKVNQVEISCFSQNAAALLLYTSLGFVPKSIEERLDFEGHRAALIHLQYRKGENT